VCEPHPVSIIRFYGLSKKGKWRRIIIFPGRPQHKELSRGPEHNPAAIKYLGTWSRPVATRRTCRVCCAMVTILPRNG